MVEFSMVFMIFMTIIVSIIEFTIFFSSFITVTYASRDAAQLVAVYGNTAGADCAVLQRITQDIGTPANPTLIKSVDIYWVNPADPAGGAVLNATTTYTYDGGNQTPCTKPDGTKPVLPFTPPAPSILGYVESARCNVNMGIDCPQTAGRSHGTVDTIAVTIRYQYKWITPFPGLVLGGGGNGPVITQTSQMRLEPTR
jgi:TadE-like protein